MLHNVRYAWRLILVIHLFSSAVVLRAQESGADAAVASKTPPATDASPRQDVIERRTKVAGELESARIALESSTESGNAPAAHLTKETELLTRLDLLFGQLLAALDQEAELKTSQAQSEADLQSLRARGPSEERPFRFMLLETTRDQLNAQIERGETIESVTQSAQDALVAARESVDEKERNRRKAKEAVDTNREEAARAALSVALRLAELDSRIAAAQARLRAQELANHRLDEELYQLRITFLREKVALILPEVRFRKAGLDEILLQLDEEEYRLNRNLDLVKPLLGARDTAWVGARAQLDGSPTRNAALAEEVEARSLARQAVQREITTLGKQLQYVAEDKTVWQRRFEAFNQEIDAEKLRAWEKETKESLAQLDRDIRRQNAELSELRQSQATLENKIGAPDAPAPDLRGWLDEQDRQLAGLTRVAQAGLARVEASRQLRAKLLAEINEQIATVSWSERFDDAWQTVLKVWGYELTSIQDHPITVAKIVVGVILLILGTLFARLVTRVIGGRFLPRLGLNEGAAAAIQSLLFYLLILAVVMGSLRIVNVPLTAFTIAGGALAIGIGFGSQNVVNNFISGLILLAERPIRVGDLIQIEELIGTVQHIGPRSTRVRSPENMDIVVPNSSFLEKNVVNWTLSDDRCRTKIVVGIVYGSNTRDASKLLRKAVEEHGKVLAKPEPIILFADFGDNALVFEVHFWVRMRRIMDRRIIESDLRYRIDGLFREAGIVVAFPQRDVHLDSVRPLEVLLRDDRTNASPDDPEPAQLH